MNLNYRPATRKDIAALIELLADDDLGSHRETTKTPLDQRYVDAFTSIEQNPQNELTVIEAGGDLVGMLQLTFIPYLTHKGSWRCLIEGVRIAKKFRGQGLGTQIIGWAIERARQRHCEIVQLTSDKRRPDALRFYRSLGFEATHEGFKMHL